MKTTGALFALAFALAAVPAAAQTPPTGYKLHEMNFDMWCQETMHYTPERCDQRTPEDDASFKDYRRTVESYEIERLKNQRRGQELDQGILHNDPVGQDNSPRAVPGTEGTIPNPH